MLSKLVKNSNKLVKPQLNKDQDFIDQIIKIKRKYKDNSFFLSLKNKLSIFSQPQFLQNINLKQLKTKKRISHTNQTYRIRSQSNKVNKSYNLNIQNIRLNKQSTRSNKQSTRSNKQSKRQNNEIYRLINESNRVINESNRINESPQKLKLNSISKQTKQQKQQQEQKFKLSIGVQQLNNKCAKIIHSFSNSKNKLINTQKRNIKYKNNHTVQKILIQQAGFINLCFYKNKLQQLQKIKTQRAAETRNQNLRKQKKSYTQRNKIKFHKYNNAILEQQINSQSQRPWSTINENQTNQTQFLMFRSLLIKN